jgi:hypothetical protein
MSTRGFPGGKVWLARIGHIFSALVLKVKVRTEAQNVRVTSVSMTGYGQIRVTSEYP